MCKCSYNNKTKTTIIIIIIKNGLINNNFQNSLTYY